jgi:hypothetical protein
MASLPRDRLAALRAELYEERRGGVHPGVYQLVDGQSWVLVGRAGKRWWLKFEAHRDDDSIHAYDPATGNIFVLQRVHVLDVWVYHNSTIHLRMLRNL